MSTSGDLPTGQRLAILAALTGAAALCGRYLFVVAADMAAMGDMTTAMPTNGPVDLVLLLRITTQISQQHRHAGPNLTRV
jgi:hypothetical protein